MFRIAFAVLAAAMVFAATPTATADVDPFSRREAVVRSRARFFAKIAVQGDYSGEWVVYRDKKVTAFLDLVDRFPGVNVLRNERRSQVHAGTKNVGITRGVFAAY